MNDLFKAAILVVLVSFALAAFAYPYLPESIPSHWNARGEVDAYSEKGGGLFVFPLISLFILALFWLMPRIDPLRKNYKLFEGYYMSFLVIMELFFLYIFGLTIFYAFGFPLNFNYVMLPGIAALFYFIGKVLMKAKRNWFFGIRTPWTMSSDRVWDATHLAGSRLFKISAVIMLAGLFFIEYAMLFIIVPAITVSSYLFVYSFLEYMGTQKKPAKKKR